MLSPIVDPRDKQQYFNPPRGYDTPYWGAILCRPSNGQKYFGAWDAINGEIGTTATIAAAKNPRTGARCWGVTTSIWLGDPWPATDVEWSDEQTLLVIVKVDGEHSFMQLDWREADGTLRADRTNFTLKSYTAKEIFFGYVHSSYLTVAGLKTGSSAEAEIDAVCAWAVPYLPARGFMETEPS